MKRRSFLLGFGAALAAPAIVRADSLMKLWLPPEPKIITNPDYFYEEGAWTPTISGGYSYTEGTGRYVKVGKQIWATAEFAPSPLYTNGYSISGLPFEPGRHV